MQRLQENVLFVIVQKFTQMSWEFHVMIVVQP